LVEKKTLVKECGVEAVPNYRKETKLAAKATAIISRDPTSSQLTAEEWREM